MQHDREEDAALGSQKYVGEDQGLGHKISQQQPTYLIVVIHCVGLGLSVMSTVEPNLVAVPGALRLSRGAWTSSVRRP
jgi:hypothetical protein